MRIYVRFLLPCVFLFNCSVVNADILLLNDALRATYVAYVNIDEELSDLRKMAGINTVVTGVGTAAGAGAVPPSRTP